MQGLYAAKLMVMNGDVSHQMPCCTRIYAMIFQRIQQNISPEANFYTKIELYVINQDLVSVNISSGSLLSRLNRLKPTGPGFPETRCI